MKKLISTLIKTFLFFVGWVILASIIPIPDSENPAIWRWWAEFIPFICVVGISLLFWIIEKSKFSFFLYRRLLKV